MKAIQPGWRMSNERRWAAHVVSGSLIIGTPPHHPKQEVLLSPLRFILHAARVLQFSPFPFFPSLARPFLNHYANRGQH